ncbi:MAG: helix-turn-helix domain-containing protein [Deltaproteobacteria bacterium]|jgi:transcriptional regulator with XRE-family HTH domain|nr:helix-turn-helix domain-containing protein [Deltaproteobacteria bacterium]
MRNVDKTFGENLKHYRKLKNLTQAELGNRIGIGHGSISLWEKGERSPSITHIFRLCKALGCSADKLLGIDVAPLQRRSKNIEWITTFPKSSVLDFTEEIHDGISLFEHIVSDGKDFSSIRELDEKYNNLNPRLVTNKINAALLSKGIEVIHVERDLRREEALKQKYNLLHCVVAKLDDLPLDGIVDVPIKSEAVAFLTVKYCTPLLRGLERVGFTGGYPLARFLNLIPPYHPDLTGISWYSFLATQRHLSVAPMSGSANGLINQLLYRQPHTKGFTMPFINIERRGIEYYKKAKGEEKIELDYANQIKRTAAYVQTGFIAVGDPQTDYQMAEIEAVNPKLSKLFHNLSEQDKNRCKGDLLLRFLDENGNAVGSDDEQYENEAMVFSIELDDLRRMVKNQQNVWILSNKSKKAQIINAVLISKFANCLVIENQTADQLLSL